MMYYKYNFIEQYILDNSNEYRADINQLSQLTDKFNEDAHIYYEDILKNKKDNLIETQEELDAKEALDNSLATVLNYINNIEADLQKFTKISNFYIKSIKTKRDMKFSLWRQMLLPLE